MKLFKKIKFKPLCISLGMIILQTIFYYLAKLLQGEAHLIEWTIDSRIPFCSIFIIPYCIWYLLVLIIPYYLYLKDENAFYKFIISYSICAIIADIIFIIYPTTINRPIIENNSIFDFITNFIYSNDMPPVNCMPSLHCAISMLFILISFSSKKISNVFKVFISFVSVLIMASTLFIKQHAFIDFLTGDALMIYVYIFVISNKSMIIKIKKLLHV